MNKIKARCQRCGIPRHDTKRRLHETSAWHRRFREIRRWLAAGHSPEEVAALVGVSKVRFYVYLKESGATLKRNAGKKAA